MSTSKSGKPYFRNTTELVLFGVRGKDVRTREAGRRQVNIIKTMKREHSRKPDELYDIIEACSWGPYLELFARGSRPGWKVWGDQSDEYSPTWQTYSNHSKAHAKGQSSATAKPADSLKALPPKKRARPSLSLPFMI